MADDVKEAIKKDGLIIGSRSVLKALKSGGLKSVLYADNCPRGIVRDLDNCARLSKAESKAFEGNSAQLGEFCGKPFNILAVGIRK